MLRNRDLKKELVKAHMQTAYNYANLSKAVRRKVGCIIVKDDRIISIGYNGTPKGWDNVCETRTHYTITDEPYFTDENGTLYGLKTKPEVLHAELNALVKVAKSTESCEGATMFITCAPCFECAKLVAESGIKTVYYSEIYRDDKGIKHLQRRGVYVEKVKI